MQPGDHLARRRPARAGHVRRARPARGLRRGSGAARTRSARCSTRLTEGDPRLARAARRRSCPRAGSRSTADDLLITTGSQQALGLSPPRCCDPGDASWSRTRPTSRRCRRSSSPTSRRRRSRATTTARTREALIEVAARDRREGRLPDPDLPEPDRPHDAAPSAAPRSPRPPPRPACGWSRTTRTARCASTASRSTCSPRSPPRASARSSSRRSRRCSRRACGSATCARPPRCAARSPSPSRPPTCTPRRSPSSPPSAGWPRTTWASTSPALAAHYRPRRDALLGRRCSEHLPAGLAA